MGNSFSSRNSSKKSKGKENKAKLFKTSDAVDTHKYNETMENDMSNFINTYDAVDVHTDDKILEKDISDLINIYEEVDIHANDETVQDEDDAEIYPSFWEEMDCYKDVSNSSARSSSSRSSFSCSS